MALQVDGARGVVNAGGESKPSITRGTSEGFPTFKVSLPKLQGDYRVKAGTLQMRDQKGVYQNATPQQRKALQDQQKFSTAFKNALTGPGNRELAAAMSGGVAEKPTAYAPASGSRSSASAAAAHAAASARRARDL